MNCDELGATGGTLPWLPLALVALALVVVGALCLRRSHVQGRSLVVALMLVGASALWIAAPSSDAQAACPVPAQVAPNSLTIVQESHIALLSPGEAPSMLVGRVTNNGPDATYVTAIIASIESVDTAPNAPAGVCDASDYILIDPRMPIGEPLAAEGGSATFSGARIGFVDKPTNQDACKGAIVNLLYVTE